MREGVKWEESWVLRGPREQWGTQMPGRLVLARMDNLTAVAHANYGAGRSPQPAMLARDIEELVASSRCAVAALHIAGRRNAVADALSRLTVWAPVEVPQGR